MKHKNLSIALLLFALPVFAQADTQWVLKQSTLTYHMSHPMHEVNAVSHAAKGKGICRAGQCNFLIAVPVKSFDSGDSNRDLHMLEATRGAQFPMVIVRTEFPEADTTSPTTICRSRRAICRPDCPLSTCAFPASHARRPGADHRNDSLDMFRFQD